MACVLEVKRLRLLLLLQVVFKVEFCSCISGIPRLENASIRFLEHEKSESHMTALEGWMELELRLDKKCTVNKVNQHIINEEKSR